MWFVAWGCDMMWHRAEQVMVRWREERTVLVFAPFYYYFIILKGELWDSIRSGQQWMGSGSMHACRCSVIFNAWKSKSVQQGYFFHFFRSSFFSLVFSQHKESRAMGRKSSWKILPLSYISSLLLSYRSLLEPYYLSSVIQPAIIEPPTELYHYRNCCLTRH